MSKFSEQEVAFLTSERLLGRLATLDDTGWPHLVPVGWRYDPQADAIEVSGRNFAATKKYRNAKANPRVAFLIDDVLPPWQPRSVMIQGSAEIVDAAGDKEAAIRIVPHKVISWGL